MSTLSCPRQAPGSQNRDGIPPPNRAESHQMDPCSTQCRDDTLSSFRCGCKYVMQSYCLGIHLNMDITGTKPRYLPTLYIGQPLYYVAVEAMPITLPFARIEHTNKSRMI